MQRNSYHTTTQLLAATLLVLFGVLRLPAACINSVHYPDANIVIEGGRRHVDQSGVLLRGLLLHHGC